MSHYPSTWMARPSLLNGLLGYWPLGDARDVVTGDTAALVGSGISYGAGGKHGDCATLTAAGRLDTGVALPVGTSPRSVSWWCYSDDIATYALGQGNVGSAFYMGRQYGSLMCYVPGATFTFGAVSASAWHHCAIVFSGTTVNGYVDGVAGTAQNATPPSSSPTTLSIGGTRCGAVYYSGKMDEVGAWNRALTPAEVTALYHGGAGRFWPFYG